MKTDKQILEAFESYLAKNGKSFIREVSPRQGYYVDQRFISDSMILERYKQAKETT